MLHAQPPSLPPAVRAAAEAISQEQLAWDLAYLASDELAGRNTPSPGFDAAADYIIARLARAGLKPAGDNGTFKQSYELHETRVETNTASIEIAGQRFAFGRDFAMRSLADAAQRRVAGRVCRPRLGGARSQDRSVRRPRCARQAGAGARPGTMPRGVQIQQFGRIAVGARDAVRGGRRARRRRRPVHHPCRRPHSLG